VSGESLRPRRKAGASKSNSDESGGAEWNDQASGYPAFGGRAILPTAICDQFAWGCFPENWRPEHYPPTHKATEGER